MSEEKEREEKDQDISQLMREVEIRSDEVQEIMGFIPKWIVRWGITLIFVIIILILIGSYFFQYPDVIMSRIMVTTENPPAPLMARMSGKIDKLFIQDNQKVTKNSPIAIIENATNYEQLFQLKEQLLKLKPFFSYFDTLPTAIFNKNFSLGELQAPYSAFLKSYDDYRYFIDLDYHRKKIDSIKAQIARHKVLFTQRQRQTKIMEDEFALGRKRFNRSETLFKDGIISRNDFESAKSGYLQQEYSFEGAKSSLANSGIQISNLEQSVLDLQLQYQSDQKRLQLSLSQSYENLAGRISQWEQNYLLKTPISGVVTFTNYWSANQNVKAGDRVVTIVPENTGSIIGKVVLPILGSGKVKVGQKVNVKFDNFPFMEYGMIRGVIKSKSLIASDNHYSLEVELPNGMLSSYNIDLEFSQEMMGTAEIITEDIRLLERIMKPIKSILDKM
jgi:multidrug resistance efflux pump